VLFLTYNSKIFWQAAYSTLTSQTPIVSIRKHVSLTNDCSLQIQSTYPEPQNGKWTRIY